MLKNPNAIAFGNRTAYVYTEDGYLVAMKLKKQPRKETQEKMQPITRNSFLAIVNKAAKTPSAKPAPKSA